MLQLAAHTMLVSAGDTMGEAALMTAKYGIEPAAFSRSSPRRCSPARLHGLRAGQKARNYDNPEDFRLALGAKDRVQALAEVSRRGAHPDN